MFADLTDIALGVLIENLRTAAMNLATGQAVSDIRYGDGGQSFHPADADATERFLNRAIEERDARSRGYRNSGAIFPVGV